MIVFHTDLDNTMIYSYKHDIGRAKQCVEIYQGREISFMTERTGRLLELARKKMWIVPTTTRTKEQYERIQWAADISPYALVCNGGVLLVDGVEDEAWYRETRKQISSCECELEQAEALLKADSSRILEVRNIRKLFLFTKYENPKETVKQLKEKLDSSLLDIFYNGQKVYVVPKTLTKGVAVKRFRQYVKAEKTIAAGDSAFDIPMLLEADIGIAPKALYDMGGLSRETVVIEEGIFSERILEYLLACPDCRKSDIVAAGGSPHTNCLTT